MVRIPGVCNRDPETTVLAHIPGAGMGRKADDILGAWCCSSCHDAVDFRSTVDYPKQLLRLWHFEGVMRTQEALIAEGKIRCSD